MPDTVGVDTSVVKGADYIDLGGAAGQTFVAAETLITSITFWRPAAITDDHWGFHLYVVGTDSSGTPNPADMIQDGPTVFNFYGDGSHATPFEFDFSPPLSLPHRGTYEAAIQADPCSGAIRFLEALSDQYPGGVEWIHGRTSGCTLRAGPGAAIPQDLIFRVEFCGIATPARASTWGELKSRYR